MHYNRHRPDGLIGRINGAGGECFAVRADLNVTGFEIGLLDHVEAKFGTVDILINCAADQSIANLGDMSVTGFESIMRSNVSSVFALSRIFAERLNTSSSNAAIVNISSIEATRPAKGHGAYATSKAALEMLTKAMALEFGSNRVRVNAIAPGLIARDDIGKDWPEGVKRWEDACPLGRMGTPEDIADGVAFLTSDRARFINGTVLTIDGGMGATSSW